MRWYELLSAKITFGFKTSPWLWQCKIDLIQDVSYYLKLYLNERPICDLWNASRHRPSFAYWVVIGHSHLLLRERVGTPGETVLVAPSHFIIIMWHWYVMTTIQPMTYHQDLIHLLSLMRIKYHISMSSFGLHSTIIIKKHTKLSITSSKWDKTLN